MYYYNSTQTPNEIFDQHLPYLNQAQLKVLLVVIRQTLGWIDPKTKKRKRKDWISIQFFIKRTGLSFKSVSIAIAELIRRDLIVAMTQNEKMLPKPEDRRGKKKIYYSYAPYFRKITKKSMVDILLDVFTYPPNTKQTPTKENLSYVKTTQDRPKGRQTDRQRIQELLQNSKNPHSN
jgi:hypothetical protein